MIRSLLFLLLLLPSFVAFSQAKLVERVEKKGDEYVIPYSKYVYDNGLTLIIHEDHSDPIVHLEVTYHVGSAREEIGKSGFAHFFEHMMFQGSDHVADEEHFKIVTEAGGEMNGSTNTDRTNYYQTVPKNQLERVLWLEADRMGFLLDAVTQQKFEVQRSTVKNERGQRYDNRPYGLVSEKTGQALYPYGHPYSWSTIGYLADLDRVDVNDLKKFFLRWYGPNNADIVVAGDVNEKEVVELVGKYFGSIPRGPEVKPMEKNNPTLDQTRYISYEDNIRFPLVSFTWPTVPAGHEDEAALDILSSLLSDTKSSPLQQQFVKAGKAMNAYSYNYSRELAGFFNMTVLLMPGTTPAEADKLLKENLQKFYETPIDEADVKQQILKREVQSYRSLESVGRKAGTLSYYEFMFGNPNMAGKQLEKIKRTTAADVKRVMEKYILNKPSVALSVYPKGQPELVIAPDNFTPKIPEPSGSDPNLYGDLKYVKAKDKFDRSKMPASGVNPMPVVPEFWQHKFKGTAKAIGIESSESPTVTAVIYFPAGHVYENMEQAGLAQLTATMMEEGTKELTSEELETELERLGSSVSVFSNDEHIGISIYALEKNLDATVKLVQDIIYSPRFDEADFEREKKKTIEAINNQATQPGVIANNVFRKQVYGEGDIRGIPSVGTLETVEGLTLEDVRMYHEAAVKNPPSLVVVGDITKAEGVKAFSFLDNFTGAQPAIPALTANSITNKYYFINRPKAAQSEIRVGFLGLPYDATGEYFKASVMNYPFGGAFNSRINLNLREDKGYTYGVRGFFQGSSYPGPYVISTGVRTDATDSSLTEILNELSLYSSKGMTDDELRFTRSSLGQSEALDYETPWKKAGFLNRLQKYNLPADYPKQQQKILESVNTTDLNKMTNRYLNPDNMIVVIVGDKEVTLEPLKKMGLEFIELDSDGNPVSASSGAEE